jgi:hypothetical protein
MNVSQTIEILDALKSLGFNDESFWHLHHFRESNRQETIRSFRGYCEKLLSTKSEFAHEGTNRQVGHRLLFVLNTYKALGLSKGQSNVFNALADAAYFGIPTR